jgi:hypothetical protein
LEEQSALRDSMTGDLVFLNLNRHRIVMVASQRVLIEIAGTAPAAASSALCGTGQSQPGGS